jgi:hypothetical protein
MDLRSQPISQKILGRIDAVKRAMDGTAIRKDPVMAKITFPEEEPIKDSPCHPSGQSFRIQAEIRTIKIY